MASAVALTLGCSSGRDPGVRPDTAATATPCDGPGMGRAVARSFWSELDRHYAVFDLRLRGQRWTEIGSAACGRLNDSTGESGMLNALVAMARALDDGHIQIRATSLGRRETGWATGYPAGPIMARLVGVVEERYATRPLTRGANGRFAWGRIGSIGYLDLGAFEDLAPQGGEAADVAAARAAMTRVVAELRGVTGLVVDVRNNEGGWDAVGLEVARWFAGPRTLSYTKSRRSGPSHDAFWQAESVYVDSSPPLALDAPTVVMLSGWTFSAAETFALSMRARPRITLLGERTSGHLSDLQPATLPNGWRYTYSAERYRAADDSLYEGRGIPVAVAVPFDPVAFEQGRDVMLERSLEILGRRSK